MFGKHGEVPQEAHKERCPGNEHAGDQEIFGPWVRESHRDISKTIKKRNPCDNDHEYDPDNFACQKRQNCQYKQSCGKTKQHKRLIAPGSNCQEKEYHNTKNDQYQEQTIKSCKHEFGIGIKKGKKTKNYTNNAPEEA